MEENKRKNKLYFFYLQANIHILNKMCYIRS